MAIRQVLLELGGQERELRFGLGAWAALEDHGIAIDALTEDVQGGKLMRFKTVQRIIWAMLQSENGSSPTYFQVGLWIDGRNFAQVVEKMREAFRDGVATEGPSPPLPDAAGTGAPPGGSPSAL